MFPEYENDFEKEDSQELPADPPTPSAEAIPSSLLNDSRAGVDIAPVAEAFRRVRQEVGKVVIGQESLVELLLAALFTRGHVLLEGVPGIAKTLTAKLLAQTLDVQFARIQFTPDLMPSDVVGTTVFNLKTSEFTFNPGPVFTNVVLIDEINRAPAKTQAALFEVMEEFQVTVDGHTYPMEEPFFVIATQNPIEQEGTYKLPEAQLDRFVFKIEMHYPNLEEEKAILERFSDDFNLRLRQQVQKALSAEMVAECRRIVEQVHIRPELRDYIATLVHRTRNHPDLYLGASPRASLAILKTSKAVAAMNGRDFVTPDDIRRVTYPVLNHRIILTPEREMEGRSIAELVEEIIEGLEVPR